MATHQWKSATSGAWTDAANWMPADGQPPGPDDAAVFATGSAAAYTVTVGGPAASLLVSGDHVSFVGFSSGNNGDQGGLTVEAGAVASFDDASRLSYQTPDNLGGGAVTVNGSTLLDSGSINAGHVAIGNYGLLDESGLAASIVSSNGLEIYDSSVLGVSGGATFRVQASSATVNGQLVVDGAGSYAQLADATGSGLVEVGDHAQTVVTGATCGTLAFVVGEAANLTFAGPLGSGNLIVFAGEGASVTLYQGSPGEIAGFDASDALVVTQPVTDATWSVGADGGGRLYLTDAGAPVETLRLDGSFAGAHFKITDVGEGESKVTVTLAPTPASGAGPDGLGAMGNATLGSGAFSHEAMPAVVAGVGAPLPEMVPLGAAAPSPSGAADPTPPATRFDLAHTPSDGTAIAFVGGSGHGA